MQNKLKTSKKSDLILGVTALIVVSGLCIKGAYSLYFESSETQKTTRIATEKNRN